MAKPVNKTKEKRIPKIPPTERAPEQTYEEVRYIKHLIDNKISIRVRLANDELVEGTIEYYDTAFIRLTRQDNQNLFIFKHDIKYLWELTE